MDAKITKIRLSRMLSYDWIRIVAIIVGVIFLWVILFTMTATKITPAQQFTVINYTGNASLSRTDGKINEFFLQEINGHRFSDEVFELTTVDMTDDTEMAPTLLQARTETDEGDVIFVSLQSNPESAYTDENGETQYEKTYLDTFLNGYFHLVYDLDREAENGFFKTLEAELNKYYDGGYENGVLNEEKAEEIFRARIARTKDKRYKKDDEIEKGIEEEIDRVQKYRAALIKFDGYLADGTVTLEKSPIYANGKLYKEGYYSINLCPNEKMKGLSEYVGYSTTVEVDGEQQTKIVADNMQVCLLNLGGIEDCFQFEGLVFVADLIETVLSAK